MADTVSKEQQEKHSQGLERRKQDKDSVHKRSNRRDVKFIISCPCCGKDITKLLNQEIARRAGKVKSEKKALSSAENGKLGGRKKGR